MIRTLTLNTGSNLSVMAIKLAITFVMTPVFLRNLGAYDYGLWEMIGGVMGYMGMLDIGLRPTISRFAAKFHGKHDQFSLDRLFASSIVFMAAIGVLLLAFFLFWGVWFGSTLAPEGAPSQRYTLLLLILGIQLAITFPGFVAESFLEGFQKYGLKNGVTLINSIVGSAVIFTFITPENGLLLLAGVNAIGLSVKYGIYFILLANARLGKIKFNFGNFSWRMLQRLFGFSAKTFIQGLAARIESASDTLIIGIFLGPSAVPFYSIPANLVRYFRMFGMNLTHAFMPAFSNLHARQKVEESQKLYLVGSRYVVGMIFPAAAGLAVVGGPFLGIWIGDEYRDLGEIIIWLLLVFFVVPLVNPFGSRYLTALGRHGIYAKWGPVAAAINILLSLVLVKPFGIVGVAFASTVGALIFLPVYLKHCCDELGISVSKYLSESLVPCMLPTVIVAISVLCVRSLWDIDSYPKLIATIMIGSGSWAAITWMTLVRKSEREFIANRLGRMVNRNN